MARPKIALFGLTKGYLWAIVPFTGMALGAWVDRIEDERLSMFRDRSALYGGMVKPGDPPSW